MKSPSNHLFSKGNFSIWNILSHLVGSLTISIEVFTHGKMGERYLTVPSLLVMPIGYFIFRDAASPMTRELMGSVLHGFIILSIILGVLRIIRDRWTAVDSFTVHSRYAGRPLLFPSIRETVADFYVEPLFIAIVGLTCMFFGKLVLLDLYGMGVFLTMGGALMLIKGQFQYHASRNLLLDEVDSAIEQTALENALNGKRPEPKENRGFSVVGSLPDLNVRKSIGEMMEGLDPALAKMMGNTPEKDQPVFEKGRGNREHENVRER